MIAKVILVFLMLYLVANAAYQIYQLHHWRATAYVVLLIAVFYLLKNDEAISFINSRASDIFVRIANGYDWVIGLLIVVYIVITAVITVFVRRDCGQELFTCLYFILLVVKFCFVLYNEASFSLMGVISMTGLVVHPFIGLAAYGDWECVYHFSPYSGEIKDCSLFQSLLFTVSIFVHGLTMMITLVP